MEASIFLDLNTSLYVPATKKKEKKKRANATMYTIYVTYLLEMMDFETVYAYRLISALFFILF